MALFAALLHTCSATCPLSMHRLADGDPEADFLTHRIQPEAAPPLMPNCSWYPTTCCTADDALRVSFERSEIALSGPVSRGCRDLLHQLQCSICSPRQEELFPLERIGGFSVPVLRVCASFCARLYSRCGSATIALGPSVESVRDRVDQAYRNGLELCRAVGLRVVNDADLASYCFSAAQPSGRAARPEPLWVALLATSLLLAHGGRGTVGGVLDRLGAPRRHGMLPASLDGSASRTFCGKVPSGPVTM